MLRISIHGLSYSLLIIAILLNVINSGDISYSEEKKVLKITDEERLYSSKDDVEIFTIDNFKSEIYGNKRAWLIQFYSSWCGFCIQFASSWKTLATDVKDWKDVVGIAAIDCSDDQNIPICREFDIWSYPTIKYFHENYVEEPKNMGEKIMAGSPLTEYKEKLLQVIVREQYEDRGNMYPKMTPYNHTDLNNVFESTAEQTRFAFLFIQDPTDFIGQEITMDLHKIKDLVVRYAFKNNTELVNLLKTETYPTLFSIDRDFKFQNVPADSNTRDAYKLSISNLLQPPH